MLDALIVIVACLELPINKARAILRLFQRWRMDSRVTIHPREYIEYTWTRLLLIAETGSRVCTPRENTVCRLIVRAIRTSCSARRGNYSRCRAFRNALIDTKKGLTFGTSGNCVTTLVPSFSEDSGNRGTKRPSLGNTRFTFHTFCPLTFLYVTEKSNEIWDRPVRADRYPCDIILFRYWFLWLLIFASANNRDTDSFVAGDTGD